MRFGMITWNQNMEKRQNYVTQMHIASFIVYLKTVNIYADIAKNVETRFVISNYEWERSLSIGKN